MTKTRLSDMSEHRNLLIRVVALFILITVVAGSENAFAWGEKARRTIAWTAIRALPVEHQMMLRGYEESLLEGSSLSLEAVLARNDGVPSYAAGNVLNAVENEMHLLQSVSADGLSQYLAFRMGVLGQVVGAMNAPFSRFAQTEVGTDVRAQYEYDIDLTVDGLSYRSAKRMPIVDARRYLGEKRRYISDAEFFITSDYKRGVGFREYASRSVNIYFQNAVNTVADAWYTVLERGTLFRRPGALSLALRDYYVDSLAFYINHDQDEIAEKTYDVLVTRNLLSPQTAKRVADTYYDAGRYSRAVGEYNRILDEVPNWTEIRRRVSNYYYTLGVALLSGGNLEPAKAAFEAVLKYEPGNAAARTELDRTVSLIAARDARLKELRKQLRIAKALEARASQESATRQYVDARKTYRQARQVYAGVGDEFLQERLEATRAARRIESQIASITAKIGDEIRMLGQLAELRLSQGEISDTSAVLADRVLREMNQAAHSGQAASVKKETLAGGRKAG
jgi:tetratricopeptide (TPR) repeat protein